MYRKKKRYGRKEVCKPTLHTVCNVSSQEVELGQMESILQGLVTSLLVGGLKESMNFIEMQIKPLTFKREKTTTKEKSKFVTSCKRYVTNLHQVDEKFRQ